MLPLRVAAQQPEGATLPFRTDMLTILELKAICEAKAPGSQAANDKAFADSRFVNLNIPNFRDRPEAGSPVLPDVRRQIKESFASIPEDKLAAACARFPELLEQTERKYHRDILDRYSR